MLNVAQFHIARSWDLLYLGSPLVYVMAHLASLFTFPQEALVQYEQYEQEVKNLQRLIEEAHRVIQDRPVATGNIQELQTQIQHHEVRKYSVSFFHLFSQINV